MRRGTEFQLSTGGSLCVLLNVYMTRCDTDRAVDCFMVIPLLNFRQINVVSAGISIKRICYNRKSCELIRWSVPLMRLAAICFGQNILIGGWVWSFNLQCYH